MHDSKKKNDSATIQMDFDEESMQNRDFKWRICDYFYFIKQKKKIKWINITKDKF